MATDVTQVTQKEVSQEELADILGTPGPDAENVIVPEEEKPNVFSRKQVDLNYLNDDQKKSEKPPEETPPVAKTETPPGETEKPAEETPPAEKPKDIVDELTNTDVDKDTKKPAEGGNIADTIKAMIKKKLIPFEDDKKVEDYTSKDLEELIEANITDKENKLRDSIPKEFYSSLPEELQAAAKYVHDGGKDMKGLFAALSQAEQVTSMDVKDPNNHEEIIRQFLTTTGFGTAEEVNEEITGIKDRDELEKKAGQFKPKLDKMQDAIIGQKLAEQEQRQAQQAEAAKIYVGDVYKTLEPGEINGVKLDRKTQELLYSGLVKAQYPSISGKSTNLFGHLIEKYQYVEPDHGRIAEALWLLADPEGFKEKILEKGKTAATEKVVRALKTEEANRTPGSTLVEEEKTTQRRVPRSNQNFFKR